MATILLVVDDPLQASLMLSLLGQRFGLVRRVADAAEALCLIEQPGFASDLRLVVLGHRLLGIGGPEFVSELQSRLPGLPVLVLQSGSDEPQNYHAPHVSFLGKPFASDQFLDLACRLLNNAKAAIA